MELKIFPGSFLGEIFVLKVYSFKFNYLNFIIMKEFEEFWRNIYITIDSVFDNIKKYSVMLYKFSYSSFSVIGNLS